MYFNAAALSACLLVQATTAYTVPRTTDNEGRGPMLVMRTAHMCALNTLERPTEKENRPNKTNHQLSEKSSTRQTNTPCVAKRQLHATKQSQHTENTVQSPV